MTMYKSQSGDKDKKEWIRRRQMRLVQVRKQSDFIAKRLRERISIEQEQMRIEKENEIERQLNIWKMRRLRDLEQLYRNAITEIGTGHQMATEEPNIELKTIEKQKQNQSKAKERGELALEQELRLKKEAKEKKMIPVQRKKMTRQIEDLRSCLVRSIQVKENPDLQRNPCTEKQPKTKLCNENVESVKPVGEMNQSREKKTEKGEKMLIKSSSDNYFGTGKHSPAKPKLKHKVKNVVNEREHLSKPAVKTHVSQSSNLACSKPEKHWIDLAKVEAASLERLTEDDEKEEVSNHRKIWEERGVMVNKPNENETKLRRIPVKCGPRNMTGTSKKQKGKVVECYDYSIHHNCRLKEDFCSVRRVDDRPELNANELAQIEEQEMEEEKNDRENKMMLADVRGNRAIQKEKISRNYNKLLTKLEKLKAKEKLIKSYCRIPPPDVFMSDERRLEKSVRKQRIMDSKFEKIYYDVMGVNSDADLKSELYFGPYARVASPDKEEETLVTKLDFSQMESNLKPNSPVSSQCESEKSEKEQLNPATEKIVIKKTPSSFHLKRTKFRGCDESVLSEIDQVLEKGRKIRQNSERYMNRNTCESAEYHKNFETSKDIEEEASDYSLGSASLSSELCESITMSPCCGDGKAITPCGGKGSSKVMNSGDRMLELGMWDLTREFPAVRTTAVVWPVQQIKGGNANDTFCGRSTATSYRSLPSEIHPNIVTSVLKLLAQLKERQGRSQVADELILKLESLLRSVLNDSVDSCADSTKQESHEFQFNPQLNYYITKLLDMTREKIANLSVTSESDSSMQADDSANKRELNQSKKSDGKKRANEDNEESKCSEMQRENELENVITRCKNVLERYLRLITQHEKSKDSCNVSQVRSPNMTKVPVNESVNCSKREMKPCKNTSSPKKCMRAKSKSPVPACPDVVERSCELRNSPQSQQQPISPPSPQMGGNDFCDDTNCPYKSRRHRIPDHDIQDANASPGSDSFPDVMAELMKKNIISSPFHWDRGNALSDISGANEEEAAKCPENNLEAYKRHYARGLFPYKCIDSCRGACAGTFQYKCLESCKGPCSGPKINFQQYVDPSQCPDAAPAPKRKVKRHYYRDMQERDAALGIFSPVEISPSKRRTSIITSDEELLMKEMNRLNYERVKEMTKKCTPKPHPPLWEGYPDKRPVLNVHIDTPSFRKEKKPEPGEGASDDESDEECTQASKPITVTTTGGTLADKYFQPCMDTSDENTPPNTGTYVVNESEEAGNQANRPCRENQGPAVGDNLTFTQKETSAAPAANQPVQHTQEKQSHKCGAPEREKSAAEEPAKPCKPRKRHYYRDMQERDAALGIFSPVEISPSKRRTSEITSEEELLMKEMNRMNYERVKEMTKKCTPKPHPPLWEGYPDKRPVLNVHIDTPSFRKEKKPEPGEEASDDESGEECTQASKPITVTTTGGTLADKYFQPCMDTSDESTPPDTGTYVINGENAEAIYRVNRSCRGNQSRSAGDNLTSSQNVSSSGSTGQSGHKCAATLRERSPTPYKCQASDKKVKRSETRTPKCPAAAMEMEMPTKMGKKCCSPKSQPSTCQSYQQNRPLPVAHSTPFPMGAKCTEQSSQYFSEITPCHAAQQHSPAMSGRGQATYVVDKSQGQCTYTVDKPQGQSTYVVDKAQGQCTYTVDKPQGQATYVVDKSQGEYTYSGSKGTSGPCTYPSSKGTTDGYTYSSSKGTSGPCTYPSSKVTPGSCTYSGTKGTSDGYTYSSSKGTSDGYTYPSSKVTPGSCTYSGSKGTSGPCTYSGSKGTPGQATYVVDKSQGQCTYTVDKPQGQATYVVDKSQGEYTYSGSKGTSGPCTYPSSKGTSDGYTYSSSKGTSGPCTYPSSKVTPGSCTYSGTKGTSDGYTYSSSKGTSDGYTYPSSKVTPGSCTYSGSKGTSGPCTYSGSKGTPGQATYVVDKSQGQCTYTVDNPQGQATYVVDKSQGQCTYNVDNPQGQATYVVDKSQGQCTYSTDKSQGRPGYSPDKGPQEQAPMPCKSRPKGKPSSPVQRILNDFPYFYGPGVPVPDPDATASTDDSGFPYIIHCRTAQQRDAAFGVFSPIPGDPAERDTSVVTEAEANVKKQLRKINKQRRRYFAAVAAEPRKPHPPLWEGYPHKRPVLNVHVDTPSFMKKGHCPDNKTQIQPGDFVPDEKRRCFCSKGGNTSSNNGPEAGSCCTQQQNGTRGIHPDM
ncbi:UNVERIFIED_CONTAM: hypothetical protein PYX00_002352 [Menopon gallinae]|uniref:Uncharacterized protein n=1 Tax=Menopon gallinae TaxID=328185 RepID=A0AAW2IIJ5_9NEOP